MEVVSGSGLGSALVILNQDILEQLGKDSLRWHYENQASGWAPSDDVTKELPGSGVLDPAPTVARDQWLIDLGGVDLLESL